METAPRYSTMSDKQQIITSQPGDKHGEYEKLESTHPPLESGPVVTAPSGSTYSKFGMDAILLATSIDGQRDWTSGIFECTKDTTNCLLVFCCAPCVMCQLGTRIGECLCMPLFVPAAILTMRTRLRTLGGIQGSMCNDCLAVSLCGHCTLCQMKREMDAMGL